MASPLKRPTGPFKLSKKDMMTMEKEITKPKPKPTASTLKGKDAIKEYQKQISPKGMASAEAAAKKALEEKYPGMFIPGTRTSAGIYRSK